MYTYCVYVYYSYCVLISNMLTVWCDVCVYWCTAGQSRLREIFLKTDNVISGSYLAEITKEVSEGRLIDRERAVATTVAVCYFHSLFTCLLRPVVNLYI